MISGGPFDWTYPAVALLALLVLYGWSLLWVLADARRRGHDPRLAVAFVAFTLWPLGLCVWLFARAGGRLAPEGFGSAWG